MLMSTLFKPDATNPISKGQARHYDDYRYILLLDLKCTVCILNDRTDCRVQGYLTKIQRCFCAQPTFRFMGINRFDQFPDSR